MSGDTFSKAGGGVGNSNAQQQQVQDGGGITYTSGGIRFTLEQKDGVMYNVSDLADIPEVVGWIFRRRNCGTFNKERNGVQHINSQANATAKRREKCGTSCATRL